MPDHLRDSLRRQGRRFARFWVRARNRQNGACCGEALESRLVMPGRRRAGEGKMRCGGLLLRLVFFLTRKNLFLIAGNPLASPSRFCFRFVGIGQIARSWEKRRQGAEYPSMGKQDPEDGSWKSVFSGCQEVPGSFQVLCSTQSLMTDLGSMGGFAAGRSGIFLFMAGAPGMGRQTVRRRKRTSGKPVGRALSSGKAADRP